jgi:hypothetical protein
MQNFSTLRAAVREFSEIVGIPVRRVEIHDVAGEAVLRLTVDAKDEPSIDPAASPGWDFKGSVPRFNGEPVTIRGRQGDLLKLLATALTIGDLKRAWGDYGSEVECGTVR